MKMKDIDFLEALKGYIEDAEEGIDSEWGKGRTSERLIEDGAMPKIYAEVIERLKAMKLIA
jgi:hypothetical protein